MQLQPKFPADASPSLRMAIQRVYEDVNRIPGRYLGAFASTGLPATVDPSLYYCWVWVTDEARPAWLDPAGPSWRRPAMGSGAGSFTTLAASGASTLAAVSATTLSITQGAIISGTYLPTLTNVANLDASTAYNAQYIRVGNVVNVSGKCDVDPTLTASTKLGISLPVASTLSAAEKCSGSAVSNSIASEAAAIEADTVNNRAQMEWITASVANHSMYFSFQYLVT